MLSHKIFYLEVPNKLIYLEFTLPLYKMFLKSSTGGVWDLNGVAHYGNLRVMLDKPQELQHMNVSCVPPLWCMLSTVKNPSIPTLSSMAEKAIPQGG